MMRTIQVTLLALIVMSAPGCIQPGPPASDLTPPQVVLTALNGVGSPRFSSDETVRPTDACAKFRSFPARFELSVGDSGGVALAVVQVVFGRIVRESVSVAPAAPESSWELTSNASSDTLTIRLTPPSAGTVRTGLLAVFDANPSGGSSPF